MNNQPKRVNENHFSTEQFPEILAFCERNDNSRIDTGDEESYEYTLFGKSIYILKKHGPHWELIEQEDHKVVRVSTGRNLGMALWQGLRFSAQDKGKQEERVNVIIPVHKTDIEKALALMYYYGGYPGNFLDKTPELEIILEHFVEPELSVLAYSYIPVSYLEWLKETLRTNNILSEGTYRSLWVYKK